jgi:feruloyl esterase
MIISHGAADGVFSLTDTARWYNAVRKKMGHRTGDFVRLFAVPGMAHCGGGPSTSSYDDFAPNLKLAGARRFCRRAPFIVSADL